MPSAEPTSREARLRREAVPPSVVGEARAVLRLEARDGRRGRPRRKEPVASRPSWAPGVEGRASGSNVAAWWGYLYGELLAEPKLREVVTVYEVVTGGDPNVREVAATECRNLAQSQHGSASTSGYTPA